MFNIGWSELLLIAVVAIIVVGPKELPRLMRTFGHYAGKLRRAAADFQRQFEDAMQESELDEMRKALDEVRTTAASIHTNTPMDRPLMLPEPSPPPQETASAAKLKPASRKTAPRKAAARKAPRKVDEEGRCSEGAEAVTHDDIDASRAPLMEHLVELRRRLIWSVLAVAVAFAVCFWFAKPIYNLLVWPYRLAVGVDTPIEMIYTAPQEFFFTQVKLALFGAIFLAFPVLASQIYMFVAPGLYRNERKAFLPFLAATPILFLLGAAVVYFIAMPLAMSFFLSMQQTGDSTVQIHLTARVSEYLSLIMTLILGFGICFQLPVLLTLLARAGFITAAGLKKYRRHAILGVFVVAAVLTPPDPISQIALALPTILLYEASIFAVRMAEKKHAASQPQAQAASPARKSG